MGIWKVKRDFGGKEEMTEKQIIQGKSIRVCDICNNEIEVEGIEELGLIIKNQWWKMRSIEVYDICSKHRKKIISCINELRKELLSEGKK